MLDWLTGAYAGTSGATAGSGLYNFYYHATRGTLSPDEIAAFDDPVVSDFVDKYYPPRGPVDTLVDVVTGDPLGNNRAADKADTLGLIIAAVVVVVILAVALKLIVGRR